MRKLIVLLLTSAGFVWLVYTQNNSVPVVASEKSPEDGSIAIRSAPDAQSTQFTVGNVAVSNDSLSPRELAEQLPDWNPIDGAESVYAEHWGDFVQSLALSDDERSQVREILLRGDAKNLELVDLAINDQVPDDQLEAFADALMTPEEIADALSEILSNDQLQTYWATLDERDDRNSREFQERQNQRFANLEVGILDASRRDDLETVRAYVNSGTDVNVMPVDGSRTPLHDAVSQDNLEMARILIDAGADVNLTTAADVSPLMAAAGEGNVAMVQLLVGAGANIDYSPNGKYGALEGAAFWHHTDIVTELIRLGADVTGDAGAGALSYAIKYDDSELERMLIESGANQDHMSVWLANEMRRERNR